jgi:anti-sigma B factor antagonist
LASHAEWNLEAGERLVEEGTLLMRAGLEGDSYVIQLYGELDEASISALRQELKRAEAASSSVVLDLSALEFIDSTGISLLVQFTRHASSDGVDLGFLRGTGQVARVLELTGLAKALPFVD